MPLFIFCWLFEKSQLFLLFAAFFFLRNLGFNIVLGWNKELHLSHIDLGKTKSSNETPVYYNRTWKKFVPVRQVEQAGNKQLCAHTAAEQRNSSALIKISTALSSSSEGSFCPGTFFQKEKNVCFLLSINNFTHKRCTLLGRCYVLLWSCLYTTLQLLCSFWKRVNLLGL